jgi:polar amino acid transport system substrate-binding protein
MNLKLEKVKVTDKLWGDRLTEGQIDAAMCRIIHSRSLEKNFDFSVPYFFDSLQILTLKEPLKTIENLKASKIGIVQGSVYERAATNGLGEHADEKAGKNVVSCPDEPNCFLMLGQEKVVGWLDSGMTLLEYCAKSPNRFLLVSASDVTREVVVAVPKNDSAWRSLVNCAIQDMAEDQSFMRIYDKWFGPSSAYSFPLKRAIDIWPD